MGSSRVLVGEARCLASLPEGGQAREQGTGNREQEEPGNSRGDALIARRSGEQGTTSSDLAARTLRQAFGNGHLPLKGEGALAKGSLPEGAGAEGD